MLWPFPDGDTRQGRRGDAMGGTAWLRIGAVAGFLAVAFGAFGAHGLNDLLKPVAADSTQEAAFKLRRLENFETAARYNMYHALAILVVGLLVNSGRSGTALTVAGWSFVAGILLFSGSLYAYALLGLRWLGAITPFGGVGFLLGWVALALGAGEPALSKPPAPGE
jgi:uncharacterized membrane protein YgdD (TMEM256/DUF423 family)